MSQCFPKPPPPTQSRHSDGMFSVLPETSPNTFPRRHAPRFGHIDRPSRSNHFPLNATRRNTLRSATSCRLKSSHRSPSQNTGRKLFSRGHLHLQGLLLYVEELYTLLNNCHYYPIYYPIQMEVPPNTQFHELRVQAMHAYQTQDGIPR